VTTKSRLDRLANVEAKRQGQCAGPKSPYITLEMRRLLADRFRVPGVPPLDVDNSPPPIEETLASLEIEADFRAHGLMADGGGKVPLRNTCNGAELRSYIERIEEVNALQKKCVPPAYGPPTTIYNRYNRWSQRRIWQRIFEKMAHSSTHPWKEKHNA